MTHVTVYPTKASALNVKHPHGPKMSLAGAIWPKDGFTGRRLADGSVTQDQAKAFAPPAPEREPIEEAAPPSKPAAGLDPTRSDDGDHAAPGDHAD